MLFSLDQFLVEIGESGVISSFYYNETCIQSTYCMVTQFKRISVSAVFGSRSRLEALIPVWTHNLSLRKTSAFPGFCEGLHAAFAIDAFALATDFT